MVENFTNRSMNHNLVIGATSQLAPYFPNNYVKISSRDVDLDYLRSNQWDAAYLCFAEQRIYDAGIDYITPNYLYTLKIIDSLLESCNKIVCYTSCELWNDLSGYIDVDTLPKFYPLNNEYTISKLLLMNKIKELRKINYLYKKVILMHPFYFNSIHRSEYFLFGKIFRSILNKEKIQVGNLNFYRDMVHAKFIVEASIEAKSDSMVGAVKLFNVRDFIRDLYDLNKMDFDFYVKEIDNHNKVGKEKLIMAKVDWNYSYERLLRDTQADIEEAWKQ